MSTAAKPPAVTIFRWLTANLGKGALGALTGTDAAALKAAVQIIELMALTDSRDEDLIRAFRVVVLTMQSSTQYMAFHSIAHVLDWNDRARIWFAAELPSIDGSPECRNAS